jgi:hypothetical protein
MVGSRKTIQVSFGLLLLLLLCPMLTPNGEASNKFEVAMFIQDNILGGTLSDKTLWMSDTSLSSGHVARDIDPQVPAIPLPYTNTWVVMIDDAPNANFGHPCRWVFLYDNNLSNYQVITGRQFPPIITIGTAIRNFECRNFLSLGADSCRTVEPLSFAKTGQRIQKTVPFTDCLYAVLISGGINEDWNYRTYASNLEDMYQVLQNCGFPATQIFVYYADGSDLDLDNADGDSNRHTGTSEVTGAANEENISAKLEDLCSTLDPDRDVVFVYGTNHGEDNSGLCLWDDEGFGLDNNEIIRPTELSSYTADCQVRRLFFVLDQCYSGEFLEPLSDNHHSRSAVYVSCAEDEVSWGRYYLDAWLLHDLATTTMNNMHPAGPWGFQTPGMAEGTQGIGNTRICFCWEPFMEHVRAEMMGLEFHIWWPLILDRTDTSHYYLNPSGVSRAVYGSAFDPGDGLLEIPMEMLELNLYENHSAFGPYRIIESPIENSTGITKALQTGSQYPAESFFDVYLEVLTETSPLGILVTKEPLRLSATVDTLFPLDTMYVAQDTVMLYQINSQEGPPVGRIVGAGYVPRQKFDGTVISPSNYMIFGNIGDILTASVSAEPPPPYWYQVYGPGQTTGSGMWMWQVDTSGEYRVVILNAPPTYTLAQSGAFAVKICVSKPGDATGDGIVNVADVIHIINYLFTSGPAPSPLCRGDDNADGEVNIADVVYTINYLFTGGPEPLSTGVCCQE